MAQALEGLEPQNDPRLLVGISTADDAGVFLLQDGLALVQTVDLLTPMVEDPYAFGRIAAANSLSDVYAMKQKLQTIWIKPNNPDGLLQALEEWCRAAESSGIEALQDFSRRLRRYQTAPA